MGTYVWGTVLPLFYDENNLIDFSKFPKKNYS